MELQLVILHVKFQNVDTDGGVREFLGVSFLVLGLEPVGVQLVRGDGGSHKRGLNFGSKSAVDSCWN